MSNTSVTLNALMDMGWHCNVCELPGDTKAIMKELKKSKGIEFETNEDGTRNFIMMFCPKCQKMTKHRKIKSVPSSQPIDKIDIDGIKEDLGSMARDVYKDSNIASESIHDNVLTAEIITPNSNIKMSFLLDAYTNEIVTVPVRVPRENNRTIPEGKEEDKDFTFIVSKESFEKKKNACETCQLTKKRQPSLDGIRFFWYGGDRYENTCRGCFWGYPEEWRKVVKMKLGVR